MIHVHTPPFVGNPGALETAVGILTDEELAEGFPIAKDIFVPDFPMEEVERKVMGSEYR
jgi:hypothetical protein